MSRTSKRERTQNTATQQALLTPVSSCPSRVRLGSCPKTLRVDFCFSETARVAAQQHASGNVPSHDQQLAADIVCQSKAGRTSIPSSHLLRQILILLLLLLLPLLLLLVVEFQHLHFPNGRRRKGRLGITVPSQNILVSHNLCLASAVGRFWLPTRCLKPNRRRYLHSSPFPFLHPNHGSLHTIR